MPVAAGSGEAMGGLEVLMCRWHAAYQAPVGKGAVWPAWAGFEHFPDRAPGRSILISLSNQGHRTQLLYRPWLVLARKRVLEPIPCFLSQEYALFFFFVSRTTNEIYAWGASGMKGPFLDESCLRKCRAMDFPDGLFGAPLAWLQFTSAFILRV